MSQKEIIENFGYSKTGAELILKKLNYYKLSFNTFVSKFNDFKMTVNSYGYDDGVVRNMLIQDPRLVTYSDRFETRYDNIKNILPGKRIDGNVIATCLAFKPETLNDKIKKIKSFGFTNKDLKKALERDHRFLIKSEKSFKRVFDFLGDLGIDKRIIIGLIIRNPKSSLMYFNKIENNFKKILSYGFTKEEAVKLINTINDIILEDIDLDALFELLRNCGMKDDEIRKEMLRYSKIIKYDKEGYADIVNYLKNKGFSDEQIKNITLKAKEIITYSNNKLPDIYDLFYKYGFDDESIKYIIIKNPKILYHKNIKIMDTFNKLEEFGIKEEKLIEVVKSYPNIVETNVDTLNEKLKVISNFGLMEGIYHNPKNLIQSAEKTYLRYLYMFNILEMEPETANEINILFKNKPTVKIYKDGETIKYVIPDMEKLRKEFIYYKDDEEDIVKRFSGRKCIH